MTSALVDPQEDQIEHVSSLCYVCLSDHCAVWPSPHGAAEAVPVAFPVFQRSSVNQSALPFANSCLLQQPSEQAHSGAGDELCAPRHLHSGSSAVQQCCRMTAALFLAFAVCMEIICLT